MPDKPPFIVELYEDDPDAVYPEGVLEPHPVDLRTIRQQLIDNLKTSISPTKVEISDKFIF